MSTAELGRCSMSLVLLSLLWCESYEASKPIDGQLRIASTLQKLSVENGERSLMVKVDCSVTRIRKGDFSRYKFDDVRLLVEDRRLGYQNIQIRFEFNGRSFETGLLSTIPPTWDAGYVASKPLCTLPSARLIKVKKGFYLLFFDGEKGHLLFNEIGTDKFVKRLEVSLEERKLLKEIYTPPLQKLFRNERQNGPGVATVSLPEIFAGLVP